MANVQSGSKILIAGGGIAGLATALALHRLGLRNITVVEQASSLRVTGASLAIWDNGWRALDALGVGDTLRRQHTQIQRIETLSKTSGITKYIDLQHHELRYVQRKKLLEALAEALPSNTIRFGSKISGIHQKQDNSSIVTLEDGSQLKPKVVIGCDGLNSTVAKWLGFGSPSLAGRSAFQGFGTFPQGHHFQPKALQIWGNGMCAGFAPCNEKDVFWFLIRKSLPPDAEISYDATILQEEAQQLVKDFGNKDIVEVIQRSVPSSLSLAIMKHRYLWPFIAGKAQKGNVTVAGDAMHPMTPELGQGGALALEDSVTLGKFLAEVDLEKPGEIEAALKKYVHNRKGRAFGVGVESSVSGILQSGSWWLPKLIREKVVFNRISPKMLHHTEYDCDAEISYDATILQEEAQQLVKDFGNKDIVEVIQRSVPSSLSLAIMKHRYLWPFIAGKAQKGNVTVAGDAMHPMTPELGQGGALALEDSVTLGKFLAEVDLEKPGEIEAALKKYVHNRKGRAFGVGVESSVSGILQSGSWWLPKLIREKVVFNRISPKMLHHTEYDCGTLPTPS